MTVLRCPVCRSTTRNPPLQFACPECRLPLRWAPADGPSIPLQLGLFGDDLPLHVPAKHERRCTLIAALDVPVGEGLDRELNAACYPADPGEGEAEAVRQTHQDALAVITELFHAEDVADTSADERAGELLYDRSAEQLLEVAVAVGWIAATHLRFIDDSWPGMANDMLERLGLLIAGMGD